MKIFLDQIKKTCNKIFKEINNFFKNIFKKTKKCVEKINFKNNEKKILVKDKKKENETINNIKKNKNIINILIVAIPLFIIIFLITIFGKENKNNFYWNLYNYGFVTKAKNEIYFLGYSEQSAKGIYKIDKNNKINKVFDKVVSYLNVENKYIYYVEKHKDEYKYLINQATLDGEFKKTVVKEIDYKPITVQDGWIYYFKKYNLYRIKTNGENVQELLKNRVYAYQIVGNKIYYTYRDEKNNYVLEKMDLNNNVKKVIYKNAGAYFHVKNNDIYYIMSKYNDKINKYDYTLYKIKTNGKDKEVIKKIKNEIYYININDTGVFYIKETNENKNAIYKLDFNGKEEKELVILKGNHNIINIIEEYVYYIDTNDQREIQTYRYNMKTDEIQELNIEEKIKEEVKK